MYLKKLEMKGFKSFADKVILNFERGITTIVGPNGSGKSNISDAVRLVLGEQSIKSLRGSKLEDIIFAGTEKRKPLGFAEVSLVFDNCDHMLPLDYSEVAITRRIFRSGESEFYINKTSCRLKDIYELFLDTGIGKDGYSIISQGKIDEILSTKPEERRRIFEEAAGISKYKYKKEEALKKLDATNENIKRLSDIIYELEKQLNPLFVEKNKAQKYLELIKEKKKVDITIYYNKINESEKRLEKLTEEYETIKNVLSQDEILITSQRNNINEYEIYIKNLKSNIETAKEDYFKRTNELEILNGKIDLIDEKIKNKSENLKRILELIDENENKSNILSDELIKMKKNIYDLNMEKNKLNEKIKNVSDKYDLLKYEEKEKETEIELAQGDILNILNSIADKRSKLSASNSMKDNALEKLNSINKLKEQFEVKIVEKENDFNQITKEIKNLNKKLSECINNKESVEKEYSDLNTKIVKLKDLIIQYNLEYSNIKSKISILTEMENNYEGYNNSVKNLMKHINKDNKLKAIVIGIVGNLIYVDKVYSTAIEVALGSAIQDIVINSADDAKILIDILKRNNYGRATFLPLNNIRHKAINIKDLSNEAKENMIGIASDIVQYDNILENIIKFLLGRVIVVKKLDSAILLTRITGNQYKIVTLDGDVINPGGSITGGSLRTKAQSILKRKDEINGLQVKLSNYEKETNIIKNNMIELTRNKQVKEERLKEIKSEVDNISYKINELKEQQSILDFEIKKMKLQIEENKNEIEEIIKKIEVYKTDINRYNEEISQMDKQKSEINQTIENYKANHINKSEILKDIEENLTTLKIESARNEQKLQNELHKLKEKEKELESIKNNLYENRERQEQLNELIKQLELSRNEHLNEKNNIKEVLKTINVQIINYESELNNKNHELDGKRSVLSAFENKYSLNLEKKHSLDIKIQKEHIEVENIKNRLWDEYELTLDKVSDYLIKGNIDQLKQRVFSLANEIKELGIININAINEYKNTKERYDFLKKQFDDLNNAKETLKIMIEETNKIIKSQFKNNFELIQIQFKKTFKKLFGGGNAELIMTEPDNLLETGVEINVQPPGKKLQNINLLSGGEKALVAISLLFAMLLIRPAPFCILDEIDAALDDANVDRFASFLKELSRDIQFIVVTHRKGTMSVADVMYGVTMQEKGISKLLSLKLESA
jgi:chromosome segregation protein